MCFARHAQPMGFYAPAQIVRDTRKHGVEVRPVCVNASRWDCTLEPVGEDRFAVRLGLRMVRGLANKDGAAIVAQRAEMPFSSIDDLWRRAKVPVPSLVELADADAMKEAFGLPRREALWAIKALRDEPLELWSAAAQREARGVQELDEPDVEIRPMTAGGEVVEDYRHVGLSLRRHPVEFLRADLTGRHIVTCAEAMAASDGRRLEAAGLVLVRQRPSSAKGVMFITIEDETGVANLVVWPSLFERQRRIVLSAGMMAARGKIQRKGAVVHLVADHLTDLSEDLSSVGERDGEFPLPHRRGGPIRDGGSLSPDRRDLPQGLRTHDIYVSDLHIDTIKVKTRDFR
jgi:error-prone DNA polymerase